MKFYPLTRQMENTDTLLQDYRSAWEVGAVKLGASHLYYHRLRKVYYVPYQAVSRCFRRVMMVPAKLCCGRGDFQVENLVVCDDERELVQIPLPGTKAARMLMDELQKRIPDAAFTKAAAP